MAINVFVSKVLAANPILSTTSTTVSDSGREGERPTWCINQFYQNIASQGRTSPCLHKSAMTESPLLKHWAKLQLVKHIVF